MQTDLLELLRNPTTANEEALMRGLGGMSTKGWCLDFGELNQSLLQGLKLRLLGLGCWQLLFG